MAALPLTYPFHSSNSAIRSLCKNVDFSHHTRSRSLCPMEQNVCGRPLKTKVMYFGFRLSIICRPPMQRLRYMSKPSFVVRSGLEVSTDSKSTAITIKNAKIVVESQDEDKMQLKVNLNGNETQKVFDRVLTELARSAPPIPGFRREKGGKTTKVPRDFLLQILGEDRVTKFVIQEIVSSSVAAYVKEENLKVKENKISTVQSSEELEETFAPGNEFCFNATLELDNLEIETSNSNSSET